MKYALTGLFTIALFFAFAYVLIDVKDNTLGAAEGSYEYKHYTSANASSTARTIVRGGAGELGTVTVNTTSAHPVRLYDAADSSTATTSLTAIAVIKASAAEQTFTYNVGLTKGLTVELPAGYVGDITIGVR